jgi:hypothetical protein
MKMMMKSAWVVSIFGLWASGGLAGPVLTFEGLQNFEGVSSYYNGGDGSLGTGPGPNYGITFSTYALAYIPGLQTGQITPFPGDPSPPTVLLLFDTSSPFGAGYPRSLTMDVTNGFSQALYFYDIDIGRVGSVQIWSEPDGTGSMLAQQSLPITPAAFSSSPTMMTFSGTAESVVFTGGNDQLALDNISFASSTVAEPSTAISLLVSLAVSCLIYSRMRSSTR